MPPSGGAIRVVVTPAAWMAVEAPWTRRDSPVPRPVGPTGSVPMMIVAGSATMMAEGCDPRAGNWLPDHDDSHRWAHERDGPGCRVRDRTVPLALRRRAGSDPRPGRSRGRSTRTVRPSRVVRSSEGSHRAAADARLSCLVWRPWLARCRGRVCVAALVGRSPTAGCRTSSGDWSRLQLAIGRTRVGAPDDPGDRGLGRSSGIVFDGSGAGRSMT